MVIVAWALFFGRHECLAARQTILSAMRKFHQAGMSISPVPYKRPQGSPFQFLVQKGFLASIPVCPKGADLELQLNKTGTQEAGTAEPDERFIFCPIHGAGK